MAGRVPSFSASWSLESGCILFAMMEVRWYQGAAGFATLKDAWTQLVSDSETASPFQTWEWQELYARHYRKLAKARILTLWDGETLIAVWPLVREVGLWRALRPCGCGPSDYLHTLVRTGFEAESAARVQAEINRLSDIDLIDLHQIREIHGTADWPLADTRTHATCLVLDLPATYDAYLASIGKSLRYDVRKLDKSLFQEGRARIEPIGSEDIDRGLDTLFDQHKKRWRKRGLPGAFFGKSVAFHRAWARIASEKGWLWLSILHLDDQPIGAIYAMTLGKTCYYYQAGFDPEKGSVSPGTLLVASTIRRAIEEGKTHFDFMRGDEPYKRRWKPQNIWENKRVILSTNAGARAKMGIAWINRADEVENRIRQRLEGKGLL